MFLPSSTVRLSLIFLTSIGLQSVLSDPLFFTRISTSYIEDYYLLSFVVSGFDVLRFRLSNLPSLTVKSLLFTFKVMERELSC